MMNQTSVRTRSRIFSLLFALVLTVASLITLPAASLAASTSKTDIVNGGFTSISSRTQTYTIRGNLLSQKKVSFSLYLSLPAIGGKTSTEAYNYVKKNAVFDVTVRQNGKKVLTTTVKGAGSFKLPKGLKTYTVTVESSLKNYKNTKLECINGAVYGKYKLSY